MAELSTLLEGTSKEFLVIGKNAVRVDARDKVLGQVKYTADNLTKDMLHVKVARSKYSHALIKRIDKTNALKIQTVVAVITAEDIPGLNQIGYYLPDQPLLANGKTRFIGDPIALVVGKDEYSAERGVDALDIEYEPLQSVFDPEAALNAEAPKIHEEGNLAKRVCIRKGNVDAGFSKASTIIQNQYETQRQDHAYIETEAAIAIPEKNGGITIIGTLQGPSDVSEKVASVLRLGKNQVRVIAPYLGGAFGGKDTMGIIVCTKAALAAASTRRSVMIRLTREESILAHGKRVPFKIKFKSGAAKDGKLTAIDVELLADVGAYAGQGTALMKRAAMHATGPYEVPNVSVEGKAIYTNNVFACAMNGFGDPQIEFAAESQMDQLAEELHMDPLEFRLKNVLRAGSRTGTNQLLDHSVGMEDALSKLRDAADWKRKRIQCAQFVGANKKMGVGVACSWHGNGTTGIKDDYASASIILNLDGTVTLRPEIVELGQGTHTGHMMIAAEILGVPLNDIRVEYPDTSALPAGGETHAQRGIAIGGAAVADAANKLRSKLNKLASEILGCEEWEIEIRDGKVFRKGHISNVSFKHLVDELYARGICPADYGFIKSRREDIDPVTGLGNPYCSYTFGCCIAEVEVDTETGIVNVLRISNGIDAGKVINRELIKGQLYGCTMMGLGFALMEEVQLRDGAVQNQNLTDYVIPTFADIPEMTEPVLVEHPYRYSAFGAKGVGEIALIGIPPAIVNAVFQATGVRFRQLPLTNEKVYFALKGGAMNQ